MSQLSQTISDGKTFVLIFHNNIDFIRDLQKSLRSKGFCNCIISDLFSDDFIKLNIRQIFLVVDVGVNQRHLRLIHRIFKARYIKEIIFFVNVKHYDKGEWQKVHTYADTISLQNRLLAISRYA